MQHRGKLVPKLISRHYQGSLNLRSTSRHNTDYDRVEQALLKEDSDWTIPTRQPLNRVHLEAERDMVKQLIEELLERAKIKDSSRQPSPSFDEVQELLRQGYPKYTFRSLDQKEALTSTMALNRSIRSIIGSPGLGLKEMVGRVCYNLLVSSYAPDMTTYNTLILAFDKLRTLHPDHNGSHLSESVVYSFYNRRFLKPTPTTYEVILNHYRVTNNHGRFYRTLSRMMGLDRNIGAKMRRRRVEEILENRGTKRWAVDTIKRTVTHKYIWEHATLSKGLVETVMSGLIYFDNLEHAASLFHECIQTGVVLSAKVFRQLLDSCVRALDWRCAVSVIRTLTHCNLGQMNLMINGEESDFSYVMDRLWILLDISGLYHRDKQPSSARLEDLDISPMRLYRLLESIKQTFPALPAPVDEAQTLGNLQIQHSLGGLRSQRLQRATVEREFRIVQRKVHLIEATFLDSYHFDDPVRTLMAEKMSNHEVWRPAWLVSELAQLVPAQTRLRLLRVKRSSAKPQQQEAPDLQLLGKLQEQPVFPEVKEKKIYHYIEEEDYKEKEVSHALEAHEPTFMYGDKAGSQQRVEYHL